MISIFTTATDPLRRGDIYAESIRCYEDLAEEVVVVDGGFLDYKKRVKSTWPKEFDWSFIGQQFQKGYLACRGDWVIRCDLDYIFHENDFEKIRQALSDNPRSPGVSFYKWQFVQPDRYNLKSRLVIAVNKKEFGDRIRFDGGGDLCQPTLDGNLLELTEMPQAGIPFYNYEKLTKTVEQIADDVGRMDRAYFKHFGKYLYGSGDDQSAFDGWIKMSIGRYLKPSKTIRLEEHPKYIQETIKNLRPDQFGHNAFGQLEENRYAQDLMRGR